MKLHYAAPLIGLFLFFIISAFVRGQEKPLPQPQKPDAQEKPIPRQKPRIFIGESNSWEIRGAGGSHSSSSATAAGAGAAWIYAANGNSSSWNYMAGGARPQTAEVVKTFGKRCPDVLVNNRPQMADYAVLFDHEGGKHLVAKRNKIAVFNRTGDSIFSDSTRSLGNSVKDSCAAIVADWQAHGRTSSVDPPSQIAAERTASGNENQGTGENTIAALGIVIRRSTRINAGSWILLQRKSAGEPGGRKEGYNFGLTTARACS